MLSGSAFGFYRAGSPGSWTDSKTQKAALRWTASAGSVGLSKSRSLSRHPQGAGGVGAGLGTFTGV